MSSSELQLTDQVDKKREPEQQVLLRLLFVVRRMWGVALWNRKFAQRLCLCRR
ncbi:hypothetical protein HMPREF0262_02343 [Clostridium sp. ATCC 29733]|nr:hypothetical protein HMPREF0262_02343 [Clostridium sp. ATCC 29733]